ncbi:protein adenylyltransferase SelO [Microbacterium arthrosphaerae]
MTKDAASPTTTGLAPQRPAEPPRLERHWADSFPELSRPVAPVRTVAPRLLVLGEEVARDLDFDPAYLASAEGVRFLTGESFPDDRPPVAQVYAGHQWGVFTPILGDGRAALLGEHRDRRGRLRDVHLKGIGPTPLSRVDGYAVVGPMLREFLMGEALHALGVPTTRMLAVVATGRLRERDGTALPGAVLARTAASHVRFGSFEYVRAQGDEALLRRLADHVIARHHPQAVGARHPYRALLEEVVGAVAALTAHWMRLGFVHGVLSTDNVLVAAETIDYGPCAFLDTYEPGAFFSSIDRVGRYAYDRQPSIMRWNLERLGEALTPLLADDLAAGEEVATEIVAGFDAEYRRRRADAFRAKLGLARGAAGVDELADDVLVLLAEHRVDFTGFWRDLATAAEGDEGAVRARFLGPVPELDAWLRRWRALAPDAALIRAVNPRYIARNHLVEEALQAATDGDLGPFAHLLELLRDPFTERTGSEYRRFGWPAPDGTPRHRTFCGT